MKHIIFETDILINQDGTIEIIEDFLDGSYPDKYTVEELLDGLYTKTEVAKKLIELFDTVEKYRRYYEKPNPLSPYVKKMVIEKAKYVIRDKIKKENKIIQELIKKL
jgi:hypothetical protein